MSEKLNIPYGYTKTWNPTDVWNIYDILPNPEKLAKDKVKIGIIGLGGVAQGKHLPAISRLISTGEQVEVVGVTEPRQEVADKVEAQYGFKCYQDYQDLIKNVEMDGVLVLTQPSEPRKEIIREAIDRNIHVLAEKPLLFDGIESLEDTLKKAAELCKYAEEKEKILMTGFMKRYSPPYGNAHYLIQEGKIGKPAMLVAKMCQGWAGNCLLEAQTCHLIDVIRYLMGDVKSVMALGANVFGEKDYPADNLILNFEFEDGGIGVLYQNSTGMILKPWEYLEVHGDGKWLSVNDFYELNLYDSEEGPAKQWRPTLPNTLMFDTEFNGFTGELLNFFNSIRGVEEPLVTGWDGYKALEIAVASHRSLKENSKKILLPL
ncbi:MAG: Gfo/Idh/MocA family oxidoreductase [Halanaerobiales bacterium]|nr:Gfo/Idh/MocA family oxidoreductase [Halanaerobiales bacterium]